MHHRKSILTAKKLDSPTSSHPRRWRLAITAVVLGVAVAAATTWVIRSTPGPSRLLDATVSSEQVQQLADENGLIAAPPLLDEGSLDSSAWAALFFSTVNEPDLEPDPGVVAKLAAIESDPTWAAFYASTLGVEPSDISQLLAATKKVARASDLDENLRATVVMQTWAVVSAIDTKTVPRKAAADLAQSLSTLLKNCGMNPFVAFHAQSTREQLDPSAASEWAKLFGNCGYGAMPPTATVPSAEPELLAAFAAAKWREKQPAAQRSSTDTEVLRSMLHPEASMGFDPWWAYYASAGFAAADGDVAQYSDVAAIMKGHIDDDGLVPQTTLPHADIQTTFVAVSLLSDLGQPVPESLNKSTLGRATALMTDEPWSDDEWAAWGGILYMLQIEVSKAQRQELADHVTSCLKETAVPGNARGIGLCRATAAQYGWPDDVKVDWTKWDDAPAESLMDAIVALKESPPQPRASRAAQEIVERASATHTSILADVLLAAKISHFTLSNDDKDSIAKYLEQRRATPPFTGFLKEMKNDRNPSLEATARVAAAERWNLLAHD